MDSLAVQKEYRASLCLVYSPNITVLQNQQARVTTRISTSMQPTDPVQIFLDLCWVCILLGLTCDSGVNTLPAMQEIQIRSLGEENPLEEGMATHSSILVEESPWTEEPDRLQSMESQTVGYD